MNYATKIKTAIASALCVMVGMAFAASGSNDIPIYGATFESVANPPVNDQAYIDGHAISEYGTVEAGEAVSGWFVGSEDDGSVVTNLGDIAHGQVLLLNTEAEILTNKLASADAAAVETAMAATGTYSDPDAYVGSVATYDGAVFESDVKFVASDTLDPGIIGGTDATKFAIYAYCDDSTDGNPTNLVVYHYCWINGEDVYTNEVFSSVNIDTATYTHLRVEMKKLEEAGNEFNVFSVMVNGTQLSSQLAYDADADGGTPGIWFETIEDYLSDSENQKVSSLNFKGTGEIDNIKVSRKVQETYTAIVDGKKYEVWATAAEAAIANDKVLESYADGQTLELAADSQISVTNILPIVTTVAGYKVATNIVNEVYTFSSVSAGATILFISADGTYTNELFVAFGETPVYAGPADYTNDYADATGIYTFNGWTPQVVAVAGDAEYTATYTSVPSVASVNGEYYATLQDALDAVKSANATEAVIDLVTDASIELTKNGNVLGGSNTTNITINGNGHTLDFVRNGTWAQVNTANNAKLVLNNMDLTSEFTGTMTEWTSEPLQNPNHNIAFNCDVELNNVASDTALSFWKDAALDTVTIAETVDVYSIWIHTTASNVSIKDLTVNSPAGRGIKVDDSYVDNRDGGAPSASTSISIDGAAFTTKDWKSAVLVRSDYPIAIATDGTIDISNVPADTTHLVWVDEDASQNFGLVTLNGGQSDLYVEKGPGSYAASFSTNGTWIAGYYKTLAGVVAVADADDTVTLLKNVTETFAVAKAMTITRNGFSAENVTADEGYVLDVTDSAYVFSEYVAPVIALSPATQDLYYNCTSVVSVVDYPAGSTFVWVEEVIPGQSTTSGGISFGGDVKPLKVSSGRKTDTLKFYSETTNGTWHLTAYVTNDNVEVAQLVASVTVKDVAAVVDGVEYTRAQWADAIAAAKENDKVLGIYLSAPSVTLAAGETLQVKVLATRNVVNLPTVTGPAGTDGTVYVVNKVKDSATGVTTFSLTAETPSVMFVSADGVTTNYLDASFKATQAGTYTLLKNISRSQLSVGTAGVVLDLNGKTFTSTATGTTAAINVNSTTGTASLTITDSSEAGTGAIVAPNYSAVQAGKNGSVAIEGGAISGKTVVVYTVSGGTAAISGGKFSMVSGSADGMLNCNDSNRGTITVTGGSFNGFDPATSNAADGNMVATGYLSVANDPSAGWYTVHPAATVIWVVDDAATTNTVAIGTLTASIQPAAPEKANYAFAGWTPEVAETVTADATYTAQFTAAAATVISIADAGATTNVLGYYATLADAVGAATNGCTVVLLGDVSEAVVNTADKNFTIDLNGHTWSSDSDVLATSAGTITIEATNGGTMTTEAAQCCAVWAKGGDVVINGGTFTSKDNEEATIYVSNADSVITINGGTFENTDPRPYRWKASLQALTLNVKNDLVGQHLIINGGTFIGNDPQLGDDTAGGTSAQSDVKFVSEGYVAIADGNGNFVVQPGYNVTFDANGGTPAPEAQRVAAGDPATAPTAPTKASADGTNYTFRAWQLSGVDYDFVAAIASDCTLVADYTATAESSAITFPDSDVEIPAGALLDWITAKGYDQAAVDNAGTTAKLMECYLLNCTPDASNGGTLSITAITVADDVNVTIKLERTGELGTINGTLKLLGATSLTSGFGTASVVDLSSVKFAEDGTYTANFSGVSAKFFKAVIE